MAWPGCAAGFAGEVVYAAGLCGEDLAGGDGVLRCFEVAGGVGGVEGVVLDEVRARVFVGVEVEVGVLG